MKQRLQREENKKEADRKKAIASDEAQLDPHFKDMAMKIAEEKRSDDEKRDAWWGGLSGADKRIWFDKYTKTFTFGASNYKIVRMWAWEEHKKENSDG